MHLPALCTASSAFGLRAIVCQSGCCTSSALRVLRSKRPRGPLQHSRKLLLCLCEASGPRQLSQAHAASLPNARDCRSAQFSAAAVWAAAWLVGRSAENYCHIRMGYTVGSSPTHRGRVQAQIASCLLCVAVAELGATVGRAGLMLGLSENWLIQPLVHCQAVAAACLL